MKSKKFKRGICAGLDRRKKTKKRNMLSNHFRENVTNRNIEANDKDTETAIDCNDNSKQMTQNPNSLTSIFNTGDICTADAKVDIQTKSTGGLQCFGPMKLNRNLVQWHSKPDNDTQEWLIRCNQELSHLKASDAFDKQKCENSNIDIHDYDALSDLIKSESCHNNLSDLEGVDMLHDLNSVMEFEESKTFVNIFSSTLQNSTQSEPSIQGYRDSVIGMDTSSIHNDDETKVEVGHIKNDAGPKGTIDEPGNGNCTAKKRKYSDGDADNNCDVINDILGELDIELGPDDTTKDETLVDQTQKLYNLKVKLMHKVPPQHMVERSSGSRTLTKIERKRFQNHGPIKTGSFTPTEDEIIKDNWTAFCENHDWDANYPQPFLNMKTVNKFYIRSLEERQNFTRFLANGLPWRTLYSVYHRFRYLYSDHERSFKRYTSKEDKKIVSHMKKRIKTESHRTLSDLGRTLHRTSHSVWLRYQSLKDHKENKKPLSEVQWTLPRVGKFIKVFMDVTLSSHVEELKSAIVPKVVWRKMEEKLGIDHNVLKTFWLHQLHMQLFCPEPIYLNDIKIKLIEYVYGNGIGSTREIVWTTVAKYFEGVTSIFLCKTFLYIVQEASMKLRTKHFPDIVEYLYNEKIRNIVNEPTDKYLPRLCYEKGEVRVIDEILD